MTPSPATATLRFDEEPALEQDEVAIVAAPAKALASKFLYAFDRWLAVSTPAEEEFVFA